MMSANIGTLLGNLIGAFLRTVLTHDQLVAWGWRIPFLSGIVNAFVAIFLHFKGVEHHPNEGEYDTDVGDDGRKENEGQVLPRYPLREGKRRIFYTKLVSIVRYQSRSLTVVSSYLNMSSMSTRKFTCIIISHTGGKFVWWSVLYVLCLVSVMYTKSISFFLDCIISTPFFFEQDGYLYGSID